MALFRRSVQVVTNANVVTNSNSRQHLRQALSNTGIKIAGVSLLLATCLIISADTNGTQGTADTTSAAKANMQSTPGFDQTSDQAETTGGNRSSSFSTTTQSSTGETSSSVNVNVNGQSIPVPENATTEQTVTNEAGTGSTQVQISNQTSGQDSGFSTSYTSVHSNSYNFRYSTGSGGPM